MARAYGLSARVVLGLILTGSLNFNAFANPQGGTVADGAATIIESGNRVDIHQSTDKVIIDWRSFSIGAGEITEFHQPSAGSIALNRVTGADPSHIFGTLRANGRVFLINPNGIMFGAGSRVDVSGLVATTSDIRNQDFMAGRMDFSIASLNPNASVVNEGDISIAESGYAALVAPHVRNSGVINARLGRVSLGAAEAFALDLYGDELVAFTVGVRDTPVDSDGNAVDALVENQGRILAGGGIVQLGARNVEAVVRNVINTDGVVYAGSMERVNGRIVLKAAGAGNVAVSGELTADGGQVGISGDENVAVTDATIAAAEVSIAADSDRSGAGDLNAGPTGGDALIENLDIDTAAGGNETGGRVQITGDRVALLGDTFIDVSGASGGGEVLIGGDYQGGGVTRSADATIVGSDVRIDADALEIGDGGRVILWADGYTRFHGDISARGGLTGGDGGFVEVSGKQHLDFAGHVDTSAIAGESGTLLLDPTDITVSADNTDGANGGTIAFADVPGLEPWHVSPAALDAVGGNITLEATNSITIDTDLTLNSAGASFTATANNDINVNANITTNGGAITLTADADGSGSGEVTIPNGTSVTSGNAAIQITTNDWFQSGTLNAGTNTITFLISDGGTIGLGNNSDMWISGFELQQWTATNVVIGDATNGDITLKQISAAESNNIGTLTLNATNAASSIDDASGGSTFNALVMNAGSTINLARDLTTDTGGITANAANGITFGNSVTSAGAVVLDADSDNNGSGTFTLNSALSTTNNTLQVTADDVAINSTIDSGTAATTILVSDAGTIGVGATAGNMTISGAELQNITATGLTIGDATNGSITVDGITAANSNNISGTLAFVATADNASIAFSNTASTFNGVSATADDGVAFNVAVSTDVGGFSVEGDADNAVDTNDNITIAAGLTLTSFGSLVLDATTGGISAAGALTLNARSGITLNNSLTSAGTTTFNADSNNNGSSTFTVASGATFLTSNNTLSITASDYALSGSINSGSAATTLLASSGGTLGLGATAGSATISGAELQNITATGLTIGDATSGNITVDGITAANSNNISGTLTLNATADNATIAFSNTASTFNALAANADDGITINVDLTTDTGHLTLEGDADNAADTNDNIQFAAGVTVTAANTMTLNATTGNISGAGTLILDAGNGVTLNDGLTTAGTTTIDADSNNNGSGTFTIAASKALSTSNNALSITADDFDLSGSLNSGSAATTLLVTNAGTFGLGATAGTATVSGAELQNITATGLTIGDATNGNITVDGISAANSNNISGTLTLNATAAGASITFQNTASTFNTLAANADNGITTNIGLTTDTGGLAFSSGNGVTFSNAVATAGATTIDADNDDNGTGTFTLNNTLNTSNNTLSVTADDIALNNTINTGSAATTILVSDGGTIGVGNTAGNMTISGAELQNITATGLTIGDTTSGNITVDGISAANSNGIAGTVTLDATQDNATITFANGASTFNALTANADDGITVNVAVITDTGNLVLEGDADNAADTNDNISVAAGVTLTSAGSMTLDATNSGIVGAGALTLNAVGGIQLNDSLVTNGAAVYDADTDNDGTGDFSIAASRTVTTNNNTLSITANDISLLGNINTGTTSTTLLVSDGGTIGLGATAGGMTISGAELQNITATGLTIGDATAGNITVDGITAANSNNISGTLTLDATAAGASIAFSNTASTFNAITADADNRISVNVDLTADTDHISLDGDADDAADGNDDIQLAAGVTLTALGPISLDAATGNMTAAGALTLDAGNGVTLFANLTTAGTTNIDADTDNNGAGTFTVSAGDTLNTTNNVLSIIADDVDLSGSLNTGSAAAAIAVSDAGTIGLGATAGGMTITGAELQNITATGLTIGDSSGSDITVNGISAANSNNISGVLTLNASNDNATLTFVTGASTFNALTANADDRITVNVNVTTDTGDLDLDGDVDNAADVNDDISVAAGVTLASAGAVILDATTGSMSGAGALTVNANNGVTINDSLTTAGTTVIDADDDTNGSGTFTIAASRTLNTTNNALQVIANKMVLNGALNSGAAATTLTPTNSAAVNLGSAADATANTVELSNTELQSITASTLTIGDASGGAITVSSDVTPGATAGAGVTVLNLISGSTVTATAGGIIESTLSVTAAGAVSFTDATTDIDTLAIDTSTGNVSYTDADGFTVGTAGTVTGVDTASGNVSLTATTGSITVANTAAANDIGATGTIALAAMADNASITIQAGADVEATGGGHSYTADDIEITGTVTATGQTVTLASQTTGDAVDVGDPGGGGDNVADTLELAGAEIQNITAANLNIGGSGAGNMTVEGITAANSNNITGTVTLTAGNNGASMTFQNTASTFNALTATADDRIAVNIGITTDTGNLSLDGDSDNAADANDDLTIAAGLTLTSAGSMTLAATTGGISAAGAVTLNADNGLTLSDSFTSAGTTILNADADSNASGNFAMTSLNAAANTLTITGASVNTGTSLTAGTTTLNGAITGSGLTVTALTLTGASAALTTTTVNGVTGDDTAAQVTMPDGATHTVNGCEKSSCVVADTTPDVTDDIDKVDTGGGTGGTGGGTGGGDTGGGDTGGDTGGDSGGDTSGGDDTGGGDDAGGGDTDGGTDTSGGDTSGGDTSGGDTSGGDASGSDSGGSDTGGGADTGSTGSGWADGSFDPAAGDVVLTGSLGNFQVFFDLLKEEGAETLELLEASEKLDNPELAALVKALGEILGEYEFVSTSIPTNAFNDKAATLLPGLLTFEPGGGAGEGVSSAARGSGYRPPSFGRFQF